MTLLSLASRQIWPQVLAAVHFRPSQLVLLYTDEESESLRPAGRLKVLLESTDLLGPGTVSLERIPHDHYSGIVDAMANFAEAHALDDTNCRVNLTGGNKLMVMAAAEWCRLAQVPCFYLERNLRVFPFTPRDRDLLPEPDYRIDPHLARNLDPIALLRCQMDAAEIVGPGQRLTINDAGRRSPEREFQILLQQEFDFRAYMNADVGDPEARIGDLLEYAVAFALLALGVPCVQRGVRLSPRVLRGSQKDEGELDLIFNWEGRLWLVDCKDRLAPENRVDRLRIEILGQTTLTPRINDLLDGIEEHLREKDLIPLKEDLLLASEVAGLLGRAICVRRSLLPIQAQEFAHSRGVPIILKPHLMRDLRSQLYANQPASLEQLKALTAARTSARA